MIYLAFSITLFSSLIFVVDLIPQFNTWQGRIKIGRMTDQEQWERCVVAVSKKWLKKTPVIKLTDNSRLIFLDILGGRYRKSTIQSWQEAALLMGLHEHENRPGAVFKAEIQSYIGKKISSTGHWIVQPSQIDAAMLAHSLMLADAENIGRNRPAFEMVYHLILSLVNGDGTVGYRKSVPDKRFVDTVGFVSPFLVHYGLAFNVPEAINLGVRQITEYVKYGICVNGHLPCHTYDIHTHYQVGLTGWGRGLAWFVIGLADTWKLLPDTHGEKKRLEELIIRTAKSSFQYQNADGSFHWLLNDHGSRKDSSITSVMAWFYSVAEAFEETAGESRNAKANAIKYLISVTRRNGAVDFSQGDTKAIGIYSQEFDILPFTQGFVLRALSTKN